MKKIYKKLSDNQKDEICSLYTKDNLSAYKIGKIYGVCHSIILKILRKKNITIIPRSKRLYKKKYSYNFNFIKTDSEELAYMMGFMFADGSLISHKRLTCQLNFKDKERLIYFCKLLDLDIKSIRDYARYQNGVFNKSSVLSFTNDSSSDKMEDIVSKWGISRKKTYNFLQPTFDDKYMIPFILGVIDGDGTINYYPDNQYRIKICGNKFALKWIKDEIENIGINNFRFEKYHNKYPDRIWGTIILTGKKNVVDFFRTFDILNKNYLMPRKWNKIKENIKNGYI